MAGAATLEIAVQAGPRTSVARPSRLLVVVAVVWAVATLPFVGKAFQTDDEWVLAIAHQLSVDPLRPYSFDVPYFVHDSAWTIHDPPLVPAWVALVSALDGGRQREVPLHLGVSLFVALAAWALYRLAERFRAPPAFATAAVLLSPIVLPGTNLMADVPVLGLSLAAIAFHVDGVDRDARGSLALGGLLAGLAFLAKYNAVVVLPVLALYSLLARRPRTLVALVIPAAIVGLWCVHNLALYGRLHFLHHVPEVGVVGLATCVPVALGVIGAAVFWLPLVARRDLFSALAGYAALGVGYVLAGRTIRDQGQALVLLASGAFVAAALARAGVEGTRRALAARALDARTRDGLFLAGWIAALLAFTWTFPPFQAVRHYYLALPPLVLLAAAGASRRRHAVALAVTVAVGLAVAAADMELANGYRTAAAQIATRHPGARVWYNGHWGWGLYATRAGFRFIHGRAEVAAGDLLVLPRGVHQEPIDADVLARFRPLATHTVPRRLPIRTFMDRMGLYWQDARDVPYAATSRPELDTFDVLIAR